MNRAASPLDRIARALKKAHRIVGESPPHTAAAPYSAPSFASGAATFLDAHVTYTTGTSATNTKKVNSACQLTG